MADVVDPATRSRMMTGMREKDTKPEFLVRRGLHAAGFRYRLHDRGLPGRTDLVPRRYQAVIGGGSGNLNRGMSGLPA